MVTLSLYDTDVRRSELTLDQGDFATERRRALHEEGWVQGLGKLGQMTRLTMGLIAVPTLKIRRPCPIPPHSP
ncbi:hypothetical protein SPURM210S_02442 [Streptomyces purpurascens]